MNLSWLLRYVVFNAMLCTSLSLLIADIATGEVVVFPQPEGLRPSEFYEVEVMDAQGMPITSFVYSVKSQWRTNHHEDASWTSFATDGPTTVRVTPLQRCFATCRVLPTSYSIATKQIGESVTLTLEPGQQVSVEFDDDLKHPLLLFANPLETDIPHPDDPHVRFFGPGIHDAGRTEIQAGETIYLAAGAYVKGRIVGRNATGAKILGLGVLSGEDLPNLDSDGNKTEHLIHLRGNKSSGILVAGPTLVNSPHFNILLAGHDCVVRNTKMISWWFSTDGVGMGDRGRVSDCFFMVNDDAIKLYHSGMHVRDCVIWQLENGAPFQFSWNMPSDNHGFDVRNVDVIRVEHEWDNDNEAVFDAIHGGAGHMSGYYFEDIRIENCDWRLMSLQVKRNRHARSATLGNISDVTLKNISVSGELREPSQILSTEAGSSVSNVLFQNLRINGRLIRSAEEMQLDADPDTTRNIRFEVGE